VTSNGFGSADPPAGTHWLYALPRVCSAEHSSALGNSCFPTPPFYVPIWFINFRQQKLLGAAVRTEAI
jgi:hypothetical protein